MGKKVYKMTEEQVASILGKKKESEISDMKAPGLQLSTEGTKKKTKYKITEDQLKRIFNQLGDKAIEEMDNYNYPAGSDTSDAPWNQEDPAVKAGHYEKGSIEVVMSDKGEHLFKDKSNNMFIYVTDENFDDVYELLEDYLDIAQAEDEDEDGKYMSNDPNWKDYISSEEIGEAFASHMNYSKNKGTGLPMTASVEEYEDGEHPYLMITPQNSVAVMDVIFSDKIKGAIS